MTPWRVGAAPAPLPDPATEWGWSATQAYAIGLDRRLRAVEDATERGASLALALAAAVGILGGVLAAGGVLAWREARRG